METTGGEYIHGTEPVEQQRLSLLSERFGSGRLQRVLSETASRSAPELARALIAATSRWGGAAGDDRTVVIVRVTGERE